MDDIEIRLCAPKVETNIAGSDTTVCYGNSLDITGTYISDCTFGSELEYRWEFRPPGNPVWTVIPPVSGTVTLSDCNVPETISKTVSITSAAKTGEGYYRMLVSSPSSIGNVNCRAASDSIYVHIVDKYVAPDIRIQVCPSPPNREIHMPAYLDSTDYDRVLWEKVSGYPPVSVQGVIEGNFARGATYTYKYTLLSPEYSGCGHSTAKVYIRSLSGNAFRQTLDTVAVCAAYSDSRSVNLNRIFGIEHGLGGIVPDASRDPDGVAANSVHTLSAPSQYAGATVFNAQKAYSEAGPGYDITYRGTAAKRFDFVCAATCTGGTKRIVLIVTQ
jgi:hypothetical protein